MKKDTPVALPVWVELYTIWHPGLGRRVQVQKSSDGDTRSVIVR